MRLFPRAALGRRSRPRSPTPGLIILMLPSAGLMAHSRPRPTAHPWRRQLSRKCRILFEPSAPWLTNRTMPTEIIVPRLGWSMEQGAFVAWLKHDGDFVHAGEFL